MLFQCLCGLEPVCHFTQADDEPLKKEYPFIMNELSPKEEMQQLIGQCMDKGSFFDSVDAFRLYEKAFGLDDYIENCWQSALSCAPLISLICFDISDNALDSFLQSQKYSNFEIVRIDQHDSLEDIWAYLRAAQSEYLCFWETNHEYHPYKIIEMLRSFKQFPDMDTVISPRNFITANHIVISNPRSEYQSVLQDTLFSGKVFLEYCINNRINLYGSLSAAMFSTKYADSIPASPLSVPKSMMRLSLLYQLLLHGNLGFTKQVLVSSVLQPYTDISEINKTYQEYINSLAKQNIIALANKANSQTNISSFPFCKKEITFFYTDKGEYYNLQPIALEAEKRGYLTKFTENVNEKAEIGVYCQHICHPENSKFSLILLHDMTQGHYRWPDIWERERWNHFDIGIVPGKFWSNLWSQCACQAYANPRKGVFELGYPKGDFISKSDFQEKCRAIKESLHLKYDISVLYAPSWENDNKEEDFVRALVSLPVNLLVKQASWSQGYENITENICRMRELHEGKYENLFYIEPEESIMAALQICDLVISDESSVMTEALLFNKPSIAVLDWLIPDTVPSRMSSVPVDYITKCKKADLRTYVEQFLRKEPVFEMALQKGQFVFSNQGECCRDIMDAIQYYVEGTERNLVNSSLIQLQTAVARL